MLFIRIEWDRVRDYRRPYLVRQENYRENFPIENNKPTFSQPDRKR